MAPQGEERARGDLRALRPPLDGSRAASQLLERRGRAALGRDRGDHGSVPRRGLLGFAGEPKHRVELLPLELHGQVPVVQVPATEVLADRLVFGRRRVQRRSAPEAYAGRVELERRGQVAADVVVVRIQLFALPVLRDRCALIESPPETISALIELFEKSLVDESIR